MENIWLTTVELGMGIQLVSFPMEVPGRWELIHGAAGRVPTSLELMAVYRLGYLPAERAAARDRLVEPRAQASSQYVFRNTCAAPLTEWTSDSLVSTPSTRGEPCPMKNCPALSSAARPRFEASPTGSEDLVLALDRRGHPVGHRRSRRARAGGGRDTFRCRCRELRGRRARGPVRQRLCILDRPGGCVGCIVAAVFMLRGRVWARNTLTVLGVIGIVGVYYEFPQQPGHGHRPRPGLARSSRS